MGPLTGCTVGTFNGWKEGIRMGEIVGWLVGRNLGCLEG